MNELELTTEEQGLIVDCVSLNFGPEIAAKLSDSLASAPAATQGDPTREALIHAVKRMHSAKGRYHSQHATCDLFELLGLPCTREVIVAPTPQPTAPARAAEATQPAAAELTPLAVFAKGPWVWRETGQKFSAEEMDEAAFVVYREAGWRPPSQAPAGVEAAQQVVVYIQRDHLQKALVSPFLCRVEPTQRLPDFVPLHSVATSAKSHPQEGRMP